MKKYCTIIALAALLHAHAQTKQGTIVYERKVDLHRHVDDEQMKAMIPPFQTGSYELFFKDSISVYKAVPKDDAPDPFDNGGGGNHIMIKIGGPGDDGVLYKNLSSAKLLEQATLVDKNYIINDTIHPLQWKLADGTNTVLNHVCKKATAVNARGNAVVAWYTEDVAAPVGPDNYGGLPGAILMLDVDSSGIVFTATEIQPTADAKQLKAPTDGTVITRADFGKKMDELMGPPDAKGRRMFTKEN